MILFFSFWVGGRVWVGRVEGLLLVCLVNAVDLVVTASFFFAFIQWTLDLWSLLVSWYLTALSSLLMLICAVVSASL